MSNFNLEKWLSDSNASFTINGTPTLFYSLYDTLKASLVPIHNDVTSGAILAEIDEKINKFGKQIAELSESGGDISEIEMEFFEYNKIRWLNDHGPNHINAVIKRASQLLDGVVISHREANCLLSAIQLHDIGNILGRVGHEKRIGNVIADNANKIGSDHVERRYISQIAQVHGGKVANTGSKDTISILKVEAPVMNEPVRLRFLASIVRFADELADERYRANATLLDSGRVPKSSEVYHAYSYVISSVMVKHAQKTIEIHFDIPKKFLVEKLGKDAGEVFLMDEIYDRTLKVYREKIYCSRFWKPHLDIEKILVIINFFEEGEIGEVLPEMTYTLMETGYPTEPTDIYKLCSDSLMDNGTPMNGEYFKNKITQK